jgi:hypothetical protein
MTATSIQMLLILFVGANLIIPPLGGLGLWLATKLLKIPVSYLQSWKAYFAAYLLASIVGTALLNLQTGEYGPSNGVWLAVLGIGLMIHFAVVPLVLGTGYGGRMVAAQLIGLATTVAITAALATPFVLHTRRVAMLARRLDNLRQVGFALAAHENEQSYPPKAASYSADGKPLLSWRVQLLPYMEQQSLYSQFRLDEPWDSPHNSSLVRLMPAPFATPGDDPTQGLTRLRGFSAPDDAGGGRAAFRDDGRPGGGGSRLHE